MDMIKIVWEHLDIILALLVVQLLIVAVQLFIFITAGEIVAFFEKRKERRNNSCRDLEKILK